jgi:hypothetical protein
MCHHLSHGQRLFRLKQHFYFYFQKLHVSLENDHHQEIYKILKIKENSFYVRDLSRVKTCVLCYNNIVGFGSVACR